MTKKSKSIFKLLERRGKNKKTGKNSTTSPTSREWKSSLSSRADWRDNLPMGIKYSPISLLQLREKDFSLPNKENQEILKKKEKKKKKKSQVSLVRRSIRSHERDAGFGRSPNTREHVFDTRF